jgi:hypothetical protein
MQIAFDCATIVRRPGAGGAIGGRLDRTNAKSGAAARGTTWSACEAGSTPPWRRQSSQSGSRVSCSARRFCQRFDR